MVLRLFGTMTVISANPRGGGPWPRGWQWTQPTPPRATISPDPRLFLQTTLTTPQLDSAIMAPILACHPGSLNAFALRLNDKDTLESVRSRAARKLAIPGDGADLSLQYLWCEVYYTLEDSDDFDVFLERCSHQAEVTVLLTSPAIPDTNPSIASVSSLPPSTAGSGADNASVYSAASYGRAITKDIRDGTSMHLASQSGSVRGGGTSVGGKSNGGDTLKSKKKGNGQTAIPEHKIKFEEFHNQASQHG